jgi:transposase-like protein
MIPALARWNGDHAMTRDTTKEAAVAAEVLLFDNWFDAIEDGVRARVRGFIETMLEEELSDALSRPRYGRRKLGEEEAAPLVVGVRHGHRERTLTGTFGKTRIAVPRARLEGEDGKTREWRSGSLRAYQRRTRAADALIAGAYLSGTNTRRVRRALNAVFAGPVGKDVVSRVWRKAKGDWDAWNARSLAEEPIVRLILDGTVARVRLDRKATSISLLVALGVRADGQKVLLPELVVVDGAPGLEKALAALWPDMAVQRCTVHKHRNLLAHAPERLHEEISNDYKDMIYAQTKPEVEGRRKAFVRKWRLKCRAVADSLEEAGDKLFTFTRFPPSQWKSIRTSNAIERLHEEFKRRIKTQTVLPCAETAAMLFWALLASGQIAMRKVDGWQTLAEKPDDQIIDLAA